MSGKVEGRRMKDEVGEKRNSECLAKDAMGAKVTEGELLDEQLPALQIRIGMEGGRKACLSKARELGAPILVSANSLWNNAKKKFHGWKSYDGLDTALDSGGFVAMHKYGGYRWTVEQYVALANAMRPAWWAQMDFCCEPEIATERAVIFKRIDSTVEHLHACIAAAKASNTPLPLPVLQGWIPSDYCSGPIYDGGFDWPALVGVGSVCRRHLNGRDGIVAVVHALDCALPSHVKLHLFGVKSTALSKLMELYPHRVASTDSMAWNVTARWNARHAGVPCDSAMRASEMGRWYVQQSTKLAQADRTQPELLQWRAE